MDKKKLTRKFTLGGPILYKGLRGHVIYMNDSNDTCTIDLNGLKYTDVPYEDVDEYNAASAKFHGHTQALNLKFKSDYHRLQYAGASQQRLDRCLREWHAEGVGISYLIMVSGHTKKTLIERGVL